MKENIFPHFLGVVGGFIATMLGGWDTSLTTLIIFMIIDYITGLLVAGVFKNSLKTTTGALESGAGFKGICKKCVILFFVFIACRLDLMFDSNIVHEAVVVGYIVNETISIIENAGLMGLPVPTIIKKSIEILKGE